PGLGGREQAGRNQCAHIATADCWQCGGKNGSADSESAEIFSRLPFGNDHQRDVDDSAGVVCFVSGCAVVEFVVSGSGAGRRRLRGATNVQRKRRKEFARRDVVVQPGELCVAALAVDPYWTGG